MNPLRFFKLIAWSDPNSNSQFQLLNSNFNVPPQFQFFQFQFSALGLIDFRSITLADVLILGTGLIAGLNVQAHGPFYAGLPERIRLIAGSSIAAATIIATTLNLFFKADRYFLPLL
jgi:hypothetical protein